MEEQGGIWRDRSAAYIVSSARFISVNSAGESVYALDAYCVDEHFAEPEKGASYSFSRAHQNIVTDQVRQTLRAPGDPQTKGECIWGAIAGTLSPGMCR